MPLFFRGSMLYLIFVLFSAINVFGERATTAVTENDPSSFVENVNVITGDFCLHDQLYTVRGAEPIHLHTTYFTKGAFLEPLDRLTAILIFGRYMEILESHGTSVQYYRDVSTRKYDPEVGEFFYGNPEKKRKWKPMRFNTFEFANTSPGLSNTASGHISGQTHLKNQHVIFDPQKDPEGKSFTLHTSNGTVRRYVKLNGQKKTPIPHSGIFKDYGYYSLYSYKLVSEELPNGHVIRYDWHKNSLREILSTNADGSKVFARVQMPGFAVNYRDYRISMCGSDGQKYTAQYEQFALKDRLIFRSVTNPEEPEHVYKWISGKKKILVNGEKKKIDFPYVSHFLFPNGRGLHIRYDGGDRDKIPRVSELLSPVGKDHSFITTHRFFYGDRSSYVLDIQGNKTSYEWNEQQRLTAIRRFTGADQLHSEERFVWDGTLISCKSLLDGRGNCIQARTFSYDEFNNITTNTLYGNLSGQSNFVRLDGYYRPVVGSAESISTYSTYSKDGRNLPLRVEEPNGLVTLYTYVLNTNLVKTKTLCEGNIPHIVHTYEYDSDYLLIREMVDDGIVKTIKKIFPKQSDPFVGMPEVIEEKYLDGSQEILLKKTVLHYGKGARVDRKDIYDANGAFQYSLFYEFDEKNRVIGETNAAGQKAEALYDPLGNRSFYREHSGLTEETSQYDYSNRLIEQQSKSDGETRTCRCSYDTKHNLEWKEDERGHKTYHIYNAFGQCIKTIEPPIPNEQGELVSPVIQKAYDSRGNEILQIDAEGNQTSIEYNAYNKPTRIVRPDGSEELYVYTSTGLLESYTDPSGVITSYKHDYLGRVVEKTISSNNTLLAKETFSFVGYHLISQTDAEGNQTTYTYDKAGRKTSETFGGETTYYTYDHLGRAHRIQQGAEITCRVYDLLDRVIEESQESLSGEILKQEFYSYNAAGDRASITRFVDGKEAVETFSYDGLHRLIQKTDALGYVETISYNNVTNVYGQNVLQKIHTDPLGLQTIETLDTHGRTATLEKRKANKTLSLTKKFYTLTGKPSLQVDTIFPSLKEVRTLWEYDTMGRLITVIEAEGTPQEKITRKTYTLKGELKTLTKPDGITISYEYNDLHQLIAINSSDRTVHHQMSYNRLGHLQTADEICYITDAKGRVLSETFPLGYKVQNEFDRYGRTIRCSIPAADCFIEYTYQGNALQSVTRKNSHQQGLYSHQYVARDLSRNILRQQHINGNNQTHTFDLLSREIGAQSPFFSQRILAFDPVGNILSMEVQSDISEYAYDDLYQLTEEKGFFTHSYRYDSMHNRLSKDLETYEINPLNQLISHLSYNANGCPIQERETSYIYDALDRLIEIRAPGFSQRFQYDFSHRCLSKTVFKNSTQTIRYFLYDGKKEIGAFDENLQICELRILGETPHAERGASIALELEGQIYLPLHDLQGNLAALIGSKNTFYRYSAFGEEKMSGSTLSPWRFSSKRSDADTKLVYYGKRFYRPDLGRWLTPDPAGFVDGMNLYAFVDNEPLMHLDKYGLWLEKREPGSFHSPQFVRDWGESFDRSIKTPLLNTWNNPQFQGALQMGFGLSQAIGGATYTAATGGLGGIAGGGLFFFRGLDDMYTGVRQILSNQRVDSGKSQLLQAWGASRSFAEGVDTILSFGSPKNAFRTMSLLGKTEEMVQKWTTSNLRIGQQVHRSYKAAIADKINLRKEYKLPSGRRIDFLDRVNGKVYELKPNNPRAIKAGMKQLEIYINELKTMPEYKNVNWEGILEVY